jgi:hypothetical protein
MEEKYHNILKCRFKEAVSVSRCKNLSCIVYRYLAEQCGGKTSDTDIKFIKDEGIITKFIIHQDGKYFECQKLK